MSLVRYSNARPLASLAVDSMDLHEAKPLDSVPESLSSGIARLTTEERHLSASSSAAANETVHSASEKQLACPAAKLALVQLLRLLPKVNTCLFISNLVYIVGPVIFNFLSNRFEYHIKWKWMFVIVIRRRCQAWLVALACLQIRIQVTMLPLQRAFVGCSISNTVSS